MGDEVVDLPGVSSWTDRRRPPELLAVFDQLFGVLVLSEEIDEAERVARRTLEIRERCGRPAATRRGPARWPSRR